MLDEHDADGYEPEHDQYLDNDDDLSQLFADEEDVFDEELDADSAAADPDEDEYLWDDDL